MIVILIYNLHKPFELLQTYFPYSEKSFNKTRISSFFTCIKLSSLSWNFKLPDGNCDLTNMALKSMYVIAEASFMYAE
jgi:hypothetical protein